MIWKIIKIFIVCVFIIVLLFLFDYEVGAKVLGDYNTYLYGLSNPVSYNVYTSRITGLNYVKESQCGFAGCDNISFYINKKDYSKDRSLQKNNN